MTSEEKYKSLCLEIVDIYHQLTSDECKLELLYNIDCLTIREGLQPIEKSIQQAEYIIKDFKRCVDIWA